MLQHNILVAMYSIDKKEKLTTLETKKPVECFSIVMVVRRTQCGIRKDATDSRIISSQRGRIGGKLDVIQAFLAIPGHPIHGPANTVAEKPGVVAACECASIR